MALDAAFLNILARQLDETLASSRVDKIFMPSRDEAVFVLRTRDRTYNLLLCARSGSARAHITSVELERPDNPSSFCMLLRKYLSRGRLEHVRPVEGERVLLFCFTSVADTGDVMNITLAVEMMGRYSNLVLVRDSVVVDALKRIDFEQSELRQLLPGVEFTLPPPQNKVIFTRADIDALVGRICLSSKPLADAVLDATAGISPVVCREIAFRARCDKPACDLAAPERECLAGVLRELQRAALGEGYSLCSVFEGARAVDFSFIELTQYGGCESQHFDDAGALLDAYFSSRDELERLKTRSHDLIKQLNNLISRAHRKHEARLSEKQDAALADKKRLYGELLTSNIGALSERTDKAVVLNYYTGEELTIPLDRRLSISANAQKYYKEYKKLTTAARMLESLLEADSREIEYLSSVLYAAKLAKTEAEFEALRIELKGAGYLKNHKLNPQTKKHKPDGFMHYKTPDGWLVLVGKNNTQNEQLTHKTADRADVWLHAKGYAGSHVILVCEKREPSETTLEAAALIAACNSSAAAGDLVDVDYTLARNVKKQPGGKPGMVFYKNHKTVTVAPNRAEAEKMREKK